MNEGTDNRSRGRSHQKRMYFLLSSTAKDLWPSPLAAPAPAACLSTYRRQRNDRKKEREREARKGKKNGNGAADSTEQRGGRGVGEWGSLSGP